MTHIKIRKRFKKYNPRDIRQNMRTDSSTFGRWLEIKNRKGFMNFELSGILLQTLGRDDEFSGHGRAVTRDGVNNERIRRNKRAALSKLKNSCIFVGHGRAVNQKLYMTRHTFRRFVRFGHLPGFVNLSR